MKSQGDWVQEDRAPEDRPRQGTAAGPAGGAKSGGRRRWLGPGLMTGAADDDPSGIVTYAQAGAGAGFALCWLMPLLYPLMAVTQEIAARLGRVGGEGLAGTLARHYPRPLVRAIVLILLLANLVNLGADLAAMGDVTALLAGGSGKAYALGLGLLCAALQIGLAHERHASVMRIAALSLLAYFAAAFVSGVPWERVAYHTLVPHWPAGVAGLLTLAALAGTTISPYTFFWQAGLEAEEARRLAGSAAGLEPAARRDLKRLRVDTWAGMALANLLAFAVMVTAGATLHGGAAVIPTAAAAAAALRPLAGPLAAALFAAGILASGFLAVPMLAGSAAVALAELRGWRRDLAAGPRAAPAAHAAAALLTLAGAVFAVLPGVDPLAALRFAAILNGIAVGPVLILMMLLAGRRRVMGKLRPSRAMLAVGWLATLLMSLAGLAALVSLIAG